jgi:hypothetical protein
MVKSIRGILSGVCLSVIRKLHFYTIHSRSLGSIGREKQIRRNECGAVYFQGGKKFTETR